MPPKVPDYYTDPYFTEAQKTLTPFYSSILKGQPDPYFAPIGEIGGEEFEDILGLTQRDVTRGVTEDIARRKVRGARGTDIIARIMGDVTKRLRFEDYSRGLKGRETLLGVGTRGLEGVREAGQRYSSDVSTFGLQKTQLESNIERQERLDKVAENKIWTDLLSSVIGTSGTVAGLTYNPAGTATRIGSAVAKRSLYGDLSLEDFSKGF